MCLNLCDSMNCSIPGSPCLSLSPRVCSDSCPLMPSNHFSLCLSLLLSSVFPSIRVFPMSWFFASGDQKYWSFSFTISPSNDYPGLISFRIGCFDFLAGSNCCFLSCIQVSQEIGKVVWYSHQFKNFPQFVVIHTVKGFGVVNKAKVDFFWNSLVFSMIKRMSAI